MKKRLQKAKILAGRTRSFGLLRVERDVEATSPTSSRPTLWGFSSSTRERREEGAGSSPSLVATCFGPKPTYSTHVVHLRRRAAFSCSANLRVMITIRHATLRAVTVSYVK